MHPVLPSTYLFENRHIHNDELIDTVAGGSIMGSQHEVLPREEDPTRRIILASVIVEVILPVVSVFIPARAQDPRSADGGNQGWIDRLRRFYHDTALASSPHSLHSLLAFADPTHITFGCDWPHATMERPRTLRHCWMNSR